MKECTGEVRVKQGAVSLLFSYYYSGILLHVHMYLQSGNIQNCSVDHGARTCSYRM